MKASEAGERGRCMWCGRPGDGLQPMPHLPEYNGIIVPTHAPIRACDGHRDQVHGYLVRVARRSGRSLALEVLAAVLVVVGGVSGVREIAAAGLALCGVWAILFPYATPATVRRLGALNAVVLVRWLGSVLLVAGVGWLVFLVASR